MYLHDGRHRYKAAREFDANRILTKIRQYDNDGNIVNEIVKVIKIFEGI